jgi:hypothetical protein
VLVEFDDVLPVILLVEVWSVGSLFDEVVFYQAKAEIVLQEFDELVLFSELSLELLQSFVEFTQ